jgi:hypothetical protein
VSGQLGWSIPLDKFFKGGLDKLELVARKTVMVVDKGVIMDTPVDKGRARGGWMASTGEPAIPSGTSEGFEGEMAQTFDLDPSGGKTVEAMKNMVMNDWKPLTGEKAIIANNVPYIDALNKGHSKQSPKHFVQLNVIRAGGIAQDSAAGGSGE